MIPDPGRSQDDRSLFFFDCRLLSSYNTPSLSLKIKLMSKVTKLTLLLVSGVLVLSGCEKPATPFPKAPAEMSIGSPTAQVLITEFSDYACPFCARQHFQTLPLIKKDYVDTGKARFVFKDFVVHPSAQKAHESAYCAAEQGKFWEFQDKIFENQGNLDVGSLKKYAVEMGLDGEAFALCLDSDRYTETVANHTKDGKVKGVNATPTAFINDKMIEGAYPYETFKEAIEKELSQ